MKKSAEHDELVSIAERELAKVPMEPPATTEKNSNTSNMRAPGGRSTPMAPGQR